MIQNKLEDTLNGKYPEVFNEVVIADAYRLKQVPFQPDIIFDIGANVGVFSRHARTLFPKARIIAVEPDAENAAHFRKFTRDTNTSLLEMALGHGTIFHNTNAPSGAHEAYLSAGLGYPLAELEAQSDTDAHLVRSAVPAARLDEIVLAYWRPGMKVLLKVDCEGAENTIWDHKPSMEVLRQMDYICMEVHFYGLTQIQNAKVMEATFTALHSLEETHTCEQTAFAFWAIKKHVNTLQ